MIWQDLVLTIFNLTATYALIPQVYHGFKTRQGTVTYQTSIITTISLFAFALAFATLNLSLSAYTCVTCAILWAVLLIQRIKYGEAKS